MTPPPGLTCHTCGQSLRHGWPDKLPLTRATPEGIQHVTCTKACDCGTALKPTNRSGRCEPCRKKAENAAYYARHRDRFVKGTRPARTDHHRPCHRCGVLTPKADRYCRDCPPEERALWAS